MFSTKCKKSLTRKGHGGIPMCFTFTLPANYKDTSYKLQISTVPSEDATRNGFVIHPTLLHMNVKAKNKIVCGTELTFPLDWKIILHIKNGIVFYVHNYSSFNKSIEPPCTTSEHEIGRLKKVSNKETNEVSGNSENIELEFHTSS